MSVRPLLSRVLPILILLLTACGAPSQPSAADLQATVQAQVQATIAAQLAAAPTATTAPPSPTATMAPTATTAPTNTPQPTPSPSPTEVPTATPSASPSMSASPSGAAVASPSDGNGAASGTDVIAFNDLGSEERGKVVVEVRRVVIARKAFMERELKTTFPSPTFDNADTVGEIIYRVRNGTDDTITIYPDQATVAVNNEQIDLSQSLGVASVGDDISGELLPGIEAQGGLWFPIKRSTPADVERMIIQIAGPSDAQYNRLGEDIRFTFDLSEHRNDPPLEP